VVEARYVRVCAGGQCRVTRHYNVAPPAPGENKKFKLKRYGATIESKIELAANVTTIAANAIPIGVSMLWLVTWIQGRRKRS